VPPGDAKAMAGGIRLLLDDSVRQASFSRAAIKTVTEQFGLARQVARYQGWYQEMLAMHHSAVSKRS